MKEGGRTAHPPATRMSVDRRASSLKSEKFKPVARLQPVFIGKEQEKGGAGKVEFHIHVRGRVDHEIPEKTAQEGDVRPI